jgi:hypothetical protein
MDKGFPLAENPDPISTLCKNNRWGRREQCQARALPADENGHKKSASPEICLKKHA